MSSQTQDVEARCTETTALLADESARSPLEEANRQDDLWKQWDDDLGPGQQEIVTTWFLETKILGRYSRSLILTFFLQYSLNVTTVFVVGHLGTKELGAVSLASMTANITGVAVYTGLATSLDTLCAQAYGSGKKELVGLHLQRMIYFLLIVTLPIGVVWLNAARILQALIPEKDLAELAGVYLRIFILGAPGYAAFEAGKRFVQAQGLFHPTLWVLLFCAPVNVLLNWLLVWVRAVLSGLRGYTADIDDAEIRMGIYWSPYRGGHHNEPTSSLSTILRAHSQPIIHGVLGWLFQARLF